MTGTLTLELATPAEALELASQERWQVLVLHRGRPVARVELPSPGETTTPALAAAAVRRWADAEVARERLAERLRDHIGASPPASIPLRCSVVVCTHRRPHDLALLLDGLGRLDPVPDEIVVVDNDPGEHDCRAAALAAGARYVREDRRGLDNARNAGIRASRGDVVAFIDDDCVPSPGWLERLPREFAHPAVGAVTGPAFPLLLDTPARRRMERQASLARGLRRLEMDWTIFRAAGAGALGVGANMAFRREALIQLGPRPFPPELDAGTLTESGGDTYAIAKLLAAGWRVVYDPATFVYHRHRADGPALHRAVFGYGVGLAAALTKLLVEDRELATPATWSWLLRQYRQTLQRRLAGRADRVETRLAWDYVRGGLLGPLRWRRALAEAARARPQDETTPAADAGAVPAATVEPAPGAAGAVAVDRSHPADRAPELSVVVPTNGRPAVLDRCLAALAAQEAASPAFEVVLVDDSPAADAEVSPLRARQLRLRRVDTHGRGAAAARNAGAAAATAPWLLFVDDDVVARPDLVRRHLERHLRSDGELVVVGPYAPRPVQRSLAALAAALWWEDLFQTLPRAVRATFVGALTGNMSIARAAFARTGGFDERFGRYRREDWEWGVRALDAGLDLAFDPAARGRHEYMLDAAGRLRAAELEGCGDGLLVRRHPRAASAILPLVGDPASLRGRRAALERAVWARRGARTAVLALLASLEWARMRLLWVRVFNAAQRLAYERGASESHPPTAPVEESLWELDLEATGPIAELPPAPSTVRVRVAGRECARVSPALGQWTPELAERIVEATPWESVRTAAMNTGCWPEHDEAHEHEPRTQVVLGPAHGPVDARRRARLGAGGAAVEVVAGAPGDHWDAVRAAADAGDRPLVATTLPGTLPDPRWLDEALVAFDGSRVGLVVGRRLPDSLPRAPLVLHAHGDRDPDLLAATAPQYVVLRRELLPALAVDLAEIDLVAPILALVRDALEGGWVVGFRDVHGLDGRPPSLRAAARAAGILHVRRDRHVASAAAELRRASLIAAWQVARGRDRRAAGSACLGALTGLLAPAAWRSSSPRRFARR